MLIGSWVLGPLRVLGPVFPVSRFFITKCDSFITKCNVYHKYVVSTISSSGKASVKYIETMQQNFNVTNNATFGMVF